MSKGIAIKTILLLLVGIIVVAVLVYLLYLYYSTSSGQFSVHECRVRLIEICTQCRNVNFDDYSLSSTLTTECSQYNEFSGWSVIDNCNNANTDDLCKLIGIT